MKIITSREKAMLVAKAAQAKKAIDIVTIDLRKIPQVADYFVIASGASTTHVRAIADYIEENLRKSHIRPYHSEGEQEALWVVLDYGDVVAHIFHDQTRRFYSLERLWSDVPQKHFKEKAEKKKKVHAKKKRRSH